MTIMDSKYGCELVSKKGKIFKFDDLSCMVKYMKINGETSTDFAHIVVNQFDKPGELIETSTAFFLKSPKYQSPMMGNIASFTRLETVDKAIEKDTLAVEYTWDELLNTLK
jgi:copper chaperone NosL